MTLRGLTIGLVCAVATCLCAHAAVTEPTRIDNELYRFAFTVQPGSIVSYERGGVGISASHVPPGAARPDYGLLVYGSEGIYLGAAEAAAAGVALVEPEDEGVVLPAKDVADAAAWAEQFAAIMTARGRTAGGVAKVKGPDGEVSLPFYVWEQRAGSQVRHALMYVVKHGDAFIYVQLESNRPLTDFLKYWVTTRLELLP